MPIIIPINIVYYVHNKDVGSIVATMKTKTYAEREELIKDFLASGKSKPLWCKEKEIACQTYLFCCYSVILNFCEIFFNKK